MERQGIFANLAGRLHLNIRDFEESGFWAFRICAPDRRSSRYSRALLLEWGITAKFVGCISERAGIAPGGGGARAASHLSFSAGMEEHDAGVPARLGERRAVERRAVEWAPGRYGWARFAAAVDCSDFLRSEANSVEGFSCQSKSTTGWSWMRLPLAGCLAY